MSELAGRRIVITRPRNKAARFSQTLIELGAHPVIFPTIEISPIRDTKLLDCAINKLESYDWLVLTSANAVDAFWNRMDALGMDCLPSSLQVAAIGSITALALQNLGIHTEFVPDEYVAEAILPGLGDLTGKWVLLPQADLARDMLPQAIQNEGGFAHPITAYHTIPANPDPEGLQALQIGVEAVTFTSPSTVINFISIAENAGLNPYLLPGDPIYACIGPITAEATYQNGFQKIIVAQTYTQAGLISAMEDYFRQESEKGIIES